MTDRELIEFAAKAAGIELTWREPSCGGRELPYIHWGSYTPAVWSPLSDDGDALRLAVALGLVVDCSRPSAGEPFKLFHFGKDGADDMAAATRRAIVSAAAAIGKEVP